LRGQKEPKTKVIFCLACWQIRFWMNGKANEGTPNRMG